VSEPGFVRSAARSRLPAAGTGSRAGEIVARYGAQCGVCCNRERTLYENDHRYACATV